MPNKDTGGPAFPATVRGPQAGRNMKPLQRFEGMTLRDYFAARFMNRAQSLCESTGGWEMELAAQCAYQMADAMLEARK